MSPELNWKQIGAIIGTITAGLGLTSQLGRFIVGRDDFEKLIDRFDRHIERSNENTRWRNERWRDLGFETTPAGTPQTDRRPVE